jgi:hypothetical protein
MIRPLTLCKKKKRLLTLCKTKIRPLTLQEFSTQTLSSRIGKKTKFEVLQLEGEITEKYLSESLYEDLQTIIKDNKGLTLCKTKIRPLTLCMPKFRLLTLCMPKICPLTLCTPKIRLLTLCIPKIIQTTLNLLFKEKERGLYAQDFAKVTEFPRADLSHAYLVGASFENARCQGAKCTPKIRLLTLCIPKICPLTSCIPKTRPLRILGMHSVKGRILGVHGVKGRILAAHSVKGRVLGMVCHIVFFCPCYL